jgi:hypothetical protein
MGAPAVAANVGAGKIEQTSRVVRDSYTLPPKEYETISRVQKRCLKRRVGGSKSEAVRAGFAALARMPDTELFELIETLVKVKTGRPTEA